jgi:hypothetical protein
MFSSTWDLRLRLETVNFVITPPHPCPLPERERGRRVREKRAAGSVGGQSLLPPREKVRMRGIKTDVFFDMRPSFIITPPHPYPLPEREREQRVELHNEKCLIPSPSQGKGWDEGDR